MVARFLTCMALFVLPYCTLRAQTVTTDSLKHKIAVTADPKKKLKSILALCAVKQSLPADTFYRYVTTAVQLSRDHGTELDKGWAKFYFAGYLMQQGLIDSAIVILNTYSLRKGASGKERQLFMRAQFLKTNGYVRKNQFREALRGYYDIVNESQAANDSFSLAMARNGLGWVHMEMGQHTSALSWLKEAMATIRDPAFYEKYSFVYANAASSYNSLGMPDSAEFFVQKAIRGARKHHDLENLANSLNILADTYIRTNRINGAKRLLEEAVSIRKQHGDPYYVISDMMQLAIFYAHHSQADKGIKLSLEGIQLAKKMGLESKLPILYNALAENYEVKGDYKKYAQTLKDLGLIKDSVYRINSVDLMNEMRVQYELQRHENIIIKQKLDLIQKSYWLNASILLMCTAMVLALFIFRQTRIKNRIRMRRMIENEKIMAQKAIVEAEDNQRKRISLDLHDSLGVQANAILYGTELLQHDPFSNQALINDLHDTAKDMLVTLRETLWAMKVTDANAADVWLRVINFSKQLARYYPSVNITTSGTVPGDFRISPDRCLNTVLVLQEALNNSVRHSGASSICLHSEANEHAWEISLEDDGRGFDPEAVQQKRESYGLINMKTRAETSGITLSITTAESKGVRIKLAIPRWPVN